jgi:TfoX/Sxy family transcriptional regulator of competence genes
MSSQQKTVDFLVEQMAEAGHITTRKMFGEYAIYCDTKVVAFVCDDELFIKPTDVGRQFIDEVVEKPAYPGSKMYFWISGDLWDDADWLSQLIKKTAAVLPLPKRK